MATNFKLKRHQMSIIMGGMDYQTKCPECGSNQLVNDQQHGELVCNECGSVVDQIFINISQPTDNVRQTKSWDIYNPLTKKIKKIGKEVRKQEIGEKIRAEEEERYQRGLRELFEIQNAVLSKLLEDKFDDLIKILDPSIDYVLMIDKPLDIPEDRRLEIHEMLKEDLLLKSISDIDSELIARFETYFGDMENRGRKIEDVALFVLYEDLWQENEETLKRSIELIKRIIEIEAYTHGALDWESCIDYLVGPESHNPIKDVLIREMASKFGFKLDIPEDIWLAYLDDNYWHLLNETGYLDEEREEEAKCHQTIQFNNLFLDTLEEIYPKRVKELLLKRDTPHYYEQKAKHLENELKEKFPGIKITVLQPWKIDPNFRKFRRERLYSLFEPPAEKPPTDTVWDGKEGRPKTIQRRTTWIPKRQSWAEDVFVTAQKAFDEIVRSFPGKRKKSLFAACFYIYSYWHALKHIVEWGCLFDYNFSRHVLKIPFRFPSMYISEDSSREHVIKNTIFPQPSKRQWAKFFNVSENTFNTRIKDYCQIFFNMKVMEMIEFVEIFREYRDWYRDDYPRIDEALRNDTSIPPREFYEKRNEEKRRILVDELNQKIAKFSKKHRFPKDDLTAFIDGYTDNIKMIIMGRKSD
jgi:ribosomal protein S27E